MMFARLYVVVEHPIFSTMPGEFVEVFRWAFDTSSIFHVTHQQVDGITGTGHRGHGEILP